MAVSADSNHLPHYDNPPVVETILGVQFDKLAGLSNAHLGAFWKSLKAEEWPTVADATALPNQTERFTDKAKWSNRLHWEVSQDPAARIQIRSASGDRMIQVQNGRLIINWLGAGGGVYPSYEIVRKEFDKALDQFSSFLAEAGFGELRPNQWEVTYINHIAKGTVWNSPADWKFFELLGSFSDIEGTAHSEDFKGDWSFQIPEKRGRLHISWRIAKSIDATESDSEFIRLNLTARGGIDETQELRESIGQGLDLGRATVVKAFYNLMSNEANEYWEYKND